MQYLRELSNGTRQPVTEEQYYLDKHGCEKHNLVYLVRTNTCCIYHMNGTRYRDPTPRPYKYGGRGRAEAKGAHLWNGA